MKRIIFLICLIAYLSGYSQDYPLSANSIDVAAGGYIHDYNNELNSHIGTWSSNKDGVNITLFIKKK